MGKYKTDGAGYERGSGDRRSNPRMVKIPNEGELDRAASDAFSSYFKDSQGKTYARLRNSGTIRKIDK